MLTNTAGVPRFPAADSRFPGPLSPAWTDGLGERVLTADATNRLELLRFRSEVATAPGFEDALRQRVAALAGFTDPLVVPAREVVQDAGYLTLVSPAVGGQRLTDVAVRIPKSKRLVFAARLLRDATRALALLEGAGPGVTHGTLTADRIVVTPTGALCLTEPVLASAMQELALWPEELSTEFGLLARADDEGEAVFDQRTSLMQLGVVGLSILLARQITLQDFEQRLNALVDEFTNLSISKASVITPALREWLQHALQLSATPYVSAAQADGALWKLLSSLGPAVNAEIDSLQLPTSAAPAPTLKQAEPAPAERPVPKVETREKKVAERAPKPPVTTVAVVPPAPAPVPAPTAAATLPETRQWSRRELQTVTEEPIDASTDGGSSRRQQYVTWAAIALAVVAIGEAIAITRLMSRSPTVVLADSSITVESAQPGDTVMVDGKAIGSTPVKVRVNPQTQAIKLVAATPAAPAIDPAAVAAKAESDRTAAVLDQAAARQRTGGVQVRTPINLTVLEGDRVLGATADGPIVASAGSHQLDFVNTALGFRVRQNVTIRAGVISPLTITPPMGRISINAQPWAQVLIDDNPVGETPLANVQVPIGEHQITFRHPQMGERRERVTVRADSPARVSTTFQR